LSFGYEISTLPLPLREGHDFLGWFDRDIGGFEIAPGHIVTNSMTLHAQWQVRTYTVSFDSNGGSFVSSRDVAHASTVEALPTPHKPYHSFAGWHVGASRIDLDYIVFQDTTLHARWTPQNVTVRFETNGGDAVSARTLTVGTRIGNLPTPKRAGHTFTGWTLDSAGRVPASANAHIPGNMTLFAQYSPADTRIHAVLTMAAATDTEAVSSRLRDLLNVGAWE